MNITRRARSKILLFFGIFLFLPIHAVFALTTTTITVDPVNDFVVEPSKFEIYVNPGETVTRYLTVTSRITQPTTFSVSSEDFEGTDDPNQPVKLLGDERGPYSLKDFLKPEVNTFTLGFGERLTLPIVVSVPDNGEPNGFYGAIIIATQSNKTGTSTTTHTQGTTKIVSRIGSLFFVRVNGEAREEGALDGFSVLGQSHAFYESAPSGFEILFKNTGTVHLVPHGLITISNMFGKKVASLPVDAYFSLPDSIRYRDVKWDNPPVFMFGRYTATLEFYKGYQNITETQTFAFWVLPWKIVVPAVLGLILLASLIYYVLTHFEFRKKK